MTEPWAPPGYDVQSLVGCGTTGEVWRARDLASGQLVALKRLRTGGDPAAVAALRRIAPLLRTVDTPYLVRLRDVLDDGDAPVLVLDLAEGGSLAALLARRGRLDPGEVVTVGAPVAQALAAAHARGLVHGDVTLSNVLFTAEGMPLLADLGVAQAVGEAGPAVRAVGGSAAAAADVRALAAVCHHLLAGAAPGALAAAVAAALDADPAWGPDAAAFAAALRRAHAAAPVRWTDSPPRAPGRGPRARHARRGGTRALDVGWWPPRRPRRTVLLGAAAAALLGLAAGAGWVSGRGGPATPAELGAVATDWSAVLDGLDAERAAAFAAADPGRLRRVYAPTAPALAADTAAIGRLRAERQVARGVRHELRHVRAQAHDGRAATLRVVDVLGAYQVVDAHGRVVTTSAARGERAHRVELVLLPDGWRLLAVSPAEAQRAARRRASGARRRSPSAPAPRVRAAGR